MKKVMLVALLGGALTACASSDADLAAAGDWFSIGYQDGVRGRTHRSNSMLNELGTVNQGEYAEGYLKGIEEFCNPDHAFQIGLSGTYYEGVCEGTPEAQKFRMEWQRGWDQRE